MKRFELLPQLDKLSQVHKGHLFVLGIGVEATDRSKDVSCLIVENANTAEGSALEGVVAHDFSKKLPTPS
jgi:hypothetical protein